MASSCCVNGLGKCGELTVLDFKSVALWGDLQCHMYLSTVQLASNVLSMSHDVPLGRLPAKHVQGC